MEKYRLMYSNYRPTFIIIIICFKIIIHIYIFFNMKELFLKVFHTNSSAIINSNNMYKNPFYGDLNNIVKL